MMVFVSFLLLLILSLLLCLFRKLSSLEKKIEEISKHPDTKKGAASPVAIVGKSAGTSHQQADDGTQQKDDSSKPYLIV